MSSTAPPPADLARVIQGSNIENSVSAFQHPHAPRTNVQELSQNGDIVDINLGVGQWIPHHLLFLDNISPLIDYRLALGREPRAVAQPFFAIVPGNPESPDYLFGTVGNPVMGVEAANACIDFERVYSQATEPPMAQMTIHTDTGDIIAVDAEQEHSYITVFDVQKAIIRWMKGMRTMSGIDDLTVRFSRWVRMVDDDGSEIEVEIWVWKGLRPLSMDLVNWHLHLCEA